MLLVAIVVYGGLTAYSILAPHSQEPRYWQNDSFWYVSLAKGLLSHHHFSRETAPPFHWDPYRTPGYPALVALGITMTGHEWGALLFTPLVAGLMLWSVVGLTHEIGKNEATTALAGWLAILLPPCLGWSAFLLTDYVHGCLTVTAFYLTLVAVRRARWSYGIGAALAWSASQWIRPTAGAAVVFVVLIALWEVRRRPQLLLVVFLVATSFLTPLYLCCRMFQDYGVFTVSLLGRHVVRYHIVSVAEALATGQSEAATLEHSFQTDAEVATKSAPRGSTQDRSDVRSAFAVELIGITENLAMPLYNVQGEAIRDALKKYPGFVVIAYAKGFFFELLWSPWESPLRWEDALGKKVMAHLMRLAYWFFLALAVIASRDGGKRGNGWTLLLLWLSFLFWVATASIAAVGGSRYRFPGDLLLIPLAACGWTVLAPKLGVYAKLLIGQGRGESADAQT